MSTHITTRRAVLWIGLFSLTTFSGCFFIPSWRIPNYEPCQKAENAWGCLVDHVEHQSPIDQPWCDPNYYPKGVYRIAPPGSFGYDHSPARTNEPLEPELGDLKPPIDAPPPE